MDFERKLKLYGNCCRNCGTSHYFAELLDDDGLKCSGVMEKDGTDCGKINYEIKPDQVSVLIVPADDKGGIYVGRRTAATGPGTGKLSLPGGHIKYKESISKGGAREGDEELNLNLLAYYDQLDIRPILTGQNPSGTENITVSLLREVPPNPGPYIPNLEISERVIYYPDNPEPLAFPIHNEAAAMHWDNLGFKHSQKFRYFRASDLLSR